MLDNLLKLFHESRDIETGKKIVDFCISEKLWNIGLVLGKYISEIYNDIDILINVSKCAYNIGEYKQSYELYDKILSFNTLDENMSNNILQFQVDCIKHISDDYIYYNNEIVQKILSRTTTEFPLVTFTITSCKRYDLFEKTVNSFLNCCLDLDRIDKWLCVDDNSSEEDREKMRNNYPFFDFYFKNNSEKGHPQSMNIIRRMVKTPYIFHSEDDWKFFAKRRYISDCLEVISQDVRIGQCLINKNYSEVENIKIVGGIYKTTKNSSKRYYIHEYCGTTEEYNEFNLKYKYMNNAAYWPYFSFRPSLLRMDVFNKVGEFDELKGHFEMDYAHRYKNIGYISAFLEGIYCLHTGRLTSERFDNSRKNAYILNGESQFTEKEVRKVDLNIKTYIVNLDRRKDRWEKFQKNKEAKCLGYERFSAIDGMRLEGSEQLQRIFDGNDYNMRAGMVGCAMSHIKLYIELVNSTYDAFCILEDDLDFIDKFRDKFLHLYKNLEEGWDMCYLGHHMWKQYKKDEYYDKNVMPHAEKWDTIKSMKYSMGGTGGYLISRKGAENLLDFINKTGMTNGIDTMQQKAADSLNIYYAKPHLIYSECCTLENVTDTDIQYNYNSLTIPWEKRVEEDEKFYSQFGEIVKTDVEPDLENLKEITFYKGENVRELLKKCKKPCYSFNYMAMVIVPNPNEEILKNRYFERLKHMGGWNINDSLKMKEKVSLISFGGTHVCEGIKSLCFEVEDYPFDTIYGGNIDVFTLLAEMTVKMEDFELEDFVRYLTDEKMNSTYVQEYNKKTVLKNIRYNISFPHEDLDKLSEIYLKRFKNFRDMVRSKRSLKLVCCTRWEVSSLKSFYYLVDMLRRYNDNICIVVINEIEENEVIDERYKECLKKEYVYFPVEFRNDQWNNEKIAYDQTKFRNDVVNVLRKYL